MFKRRDIPPLLLLLFMIILVMVTVSQLLLIRERWNSHGYASRLQYELRELDVSIAQLVNAQTHHMNHTRALLHFRRNMRRFRQLLKSEADKQNGTNASQYCPEQPPNIIGPLQFDIVSEMQRFTMAQAAANNSEVKDGGSWSPSHCMARHRVIVIIPYRDREQHLVLMLAHLHPFLQRQQLDYTIYVVEQYGNQTFNKGRLMNAAFLEASKERYFDCSIFHDVDLIPEDTRNMYSCPQQPRHLSVAIDEMRYRLPYSNLVGGVFAIRVDHFLKVNGYSNMYWGWGAEDDDMAYRMLHVGLRISRPPSTIARFKMVPHTKRKPTEGNKRMKLLMTGLSRFRVDGLNSADYRVMGHRKLRLFTHLLIDVGPPPLGFR